MAGLEGYESFAFEGPLGGGGAVSHDVYWRGTGTPVVLIQELPGISPATLRLAGRLEAAGFSVFLPHLFGPLGRHALLGNTVRVFCLRREFAMFARSKASPVADWLAALCREVRERTGAPGVGVIGMCLTGNFAISLMAEEAVLAGVACQPSMPVAGASALHMSQEEVAAARVGIDAKGPALAYRFRRDPLCPGAKFRALDRAFNGDRERVALRVLPGFGHSVLTDHFVDRDGHPTRAALDEVLAYFRDRLGA